MNTTAASFSTESPWKTPCTSRRESIESILSIQGKETDFVQDTSDTDASSFDENVEYEPVTDPEDNEILTGESSGESDPEIISTRVLSVSVSADGDLELADSEWTECASSGSEAEPECGRCAQCLQGNQDARYRYCRGCFQVRKNLFPPRPRRNRKRTPLPQQTVVPRTFSQDSGVESASSQLSALSQDLAEPASTRTDSAPAVARPAKRRADSADRKNKRMKTDYSSDSDGSVEAKSPRKEDVAVSPLVKTSSDPALTVASIDSSTVAQSPLVNSVKRKIDNSDNLCVVCFAEPKSGVFVHGRIAHICCCYKCANKVWATAKRCPVCNCKVSNVLKAVVM